MTIKKQIEILSKYRKQQGLNYTNFALELGVSRESLVQWLKRRRISMKILQEWALDNVGGWIGEMAIELINGTDERLVPCVCQTEIGDNGHCPKHTIYKFAVRMSVAETLAVAA